MPAVTRPRGKQQMGRTGHACAQSPRCGSIAQARRQSLDIRRNARAPFMPSTIAGPALVWLSGCDPGEGLDRMLHSAEPAPRGIDIQAEFDDKTERNKAAFRASCPLRSSAGENGALAQRLTCICRSAALKRSLPAVTRETHHRKIWAGGTCLRSIAAWRLNRFGTSSNTIRYMK